MSFGELPGRFGLPGDIRLAVEGERETWPFKREVGALFGVGAKNRWRGAAAAAQHRSHLPTADVWLDLATRNHQNNTHRLRELSGHFGHILDPSNARRRCGGVAALASATKEPA